MYSCLLIDHTTISTLTMCKIVRAMFHPYTFEIHVLSRRLLFITVYDVEKVLIWQAALDFEVSSLQVGYGFAETVHEAKRDAERVLSRQACI